MTTGQRVAQKRKELGLSQEALGEKLGVSRQSIYKWESDSALPEVEKLEIETRKNRFAGKLDAYFTAQPETEEEIPPLSFEMYRVKDNQISLGSLMREYLDACDRLGLDEIILTADEDRRMILYHTSGASVMIGNSILCKRIRYSVSFGDVIYITSEDKVYDLEIHYIAVIQ